MGKEVDSTGMRPRLGQTSMVLPITFDYSGGRKDKNKSAKVWAAVLMVVGFFISIGVMLNKNGFFLINILIGLAIMYVFLFIARFFLLKEGKLRSSEITIADSDFQRQESVFWGIYSMDDQYPNICRFRNGKSGVFVSLNKDVVLGKYSESEFDHYEAIADAYNICASSNIQMCHIDYMDNVGTDERLEESFMSLENVSNPDLKDMLTDIFTFQQEQMMERVTTFDAYLFLWSGVDSVAWATVQRILSCFMQANYRSWHVLNMDDLRDFTKTLLNLKEFSVMNAMSGSFSVDCSVGVVPIKVIHADGSEEVLGKTAAEKAEEARLREESKQKKKGKKQKKVEEGYTDNEEIDIF